MAKDRRRLQPRQSQLPKNLRAEVMGMQFMPPTLLENSARVELTVRCTDSDVIPKVPDAGQIVTENGRRVQIMHNGLRVVADAYYGVWTTEIIRRCRGHHEPQEEAVFHKLLEHVSDTATMLEIGGYWAYYSLWFLKNAPGRRAIVVEPDPAHLAVGQENAALNNCQIDFVQGFFAGDDPSMAPFQTEASGTIELRRLNVPDLLAEKNIQLLDILHCDAQGVELDVLLSCADLLSSGKIKFVVVSTHILPDDRDPLRHQRCLHLINKLGGAVLAEHDVHESFSGDGLIVASFNGRIDWKPPKITYNRYSESYFRNPLYDLAISQDRALGQQQILSLTQALQDAQADGVARLEQIHCLTRMIRDSEADRVARLEQIKTLTDMLEASQADGATRLEHIETLNGMLQAANADRAARLEQIEALNGMLQAANADRAVRLEQIEELTCMMQALKAEGATHLEQITTLTSRLNEAESSQLSLQEETEALRAQLRQARTEALSKHLRIRELEANPAIRFSKAARELWVALRRR